MGLAGCERMIPTEAWALGRLEYYHEMMEIDMPLSVFFHEKDWLKQSFAKDDAKWKKTLMKGDTLGLNHMNGLAVLINLDQDEYFLTKPILKKTIIHETVHSKYPYLSHGGEFNHYVEEIGKGIYPPRKRGRLKVITDWLIS